MARDPARSRKRKARDEISPPAKRGNKVKKDTSEITTIKTEVQTVKVEEETIIETKDSVTKVKVTRRRKTKEEKEREEMAIAERTIGSKILAGAHVSAAGGINS
jgi:AP endonuclease 1